MDNWTMDNWTCVACLEAKAGCTVEVENGCRG